jgi:hypothetical protein
MMWAAVLAMMWAAVLAMMWAAVLAMMWVVVWAAEEDNPYCIRIPECFLNLYHRY